jgi:AraC-like DNA-binding protein
MSISAELTPRHLASLSMATMSLESALRRRVPPAAVHAVLGAISVSHENADAATLASICRCSERTLRRRLRKFGLPQPAALIAWGKVLVASHMLTRSEKTVEGVALQLHLGGSAALVHLFRHHAGPTPGEVRERGGLSYAIDLFCAGMTDIDSK